MKDGATKSVVQAYSAQAAVIGAIRAKLQTAAGHVVYALRKAIAEPAFGQIKDARRFRRFSFRGLVKVRGRVAPHLPHPQPAEAVPGRVDAAPGVKGVDGEVRTWSGFRLRSHDRPPTAFRALSPPAHGSAST